MTPLLGTSGWTLIGYYNLCRDLGGGTNVKDFWAGLSGTISTTLKGCGLAKVNVGNCFGDGFILVYLDEVKIGEVPKTSNYEFTFNYKEGSVLKIDSTGWIARFSNFEVIHCSPCPSKFFQS